MSFPEAVWRIAVCNLIVVPFSSFLLCSREAFCFFWTPDARIRAEGARGVPFPYSSQEIRLFDDQAFMRAFDDSLFDLAHPPIAFSHWQKNDFSESSFISRFPFFSGEAAAEHF